MFFKKLHYRKLQTPAVAFTITGLVFMMLIAAYFSTPRSTAGFAFPYLAAFSRPNSPSPPSQYFWPISLRCVTRHQQPLHPRPCYPRPRLHHRRVVVADLGTAVVLVSTAAVMFFVAGLERRYIALAMVVGAFAGCVRRRCQALQAGRAWSASSTPSSSSLTSSTHTAGFVPR